MWLAFMPNARLDNMQLVFEGHYMLQLKLRQVIEVVFQVHSDQLAKVGEALEEAKANRTSLVSEIRSLHDFLVEQEIPDRSVVESRHRELTHTRQGAADAIAGLTGEMQSVTAYASELRSRFDAARAATKQHRSVVRDRETLLRRLEPLKGQYVEDESKLTFYAEVHQLFDPLHVTTCPACLQRLPTKVEVVGHACGLCGQELPVRSEPVDVKGEMNSIRQRRRELERYVSEVRSQLEDA